MPQQAIPDEFKAKDGLLVKLFVDNKGDTVVRKLDGELGRGRNAFSFQPHAIEFYHGLRRENGLACADYTPPERPPVARVEPCDEEDHDWEWLHPDDPNNREVKCAKCGEESEAEADE